MLEAAVKAGLGGAQESRRRRAGIDAGRNSRRSLRVRRFPWQVLLRTAWMSLRFAAQSLLHLVGSAKHVQIATFESLVTQPIDRRHAVAELKIHPARGAFATRMHAILAVFGLMRGLRVGATPQG